MNKPVAWMFEKDGAYMCIKHDSRVNYDGGIPLYTHPANLTDEEILNIAHQIRLIDRQTADDGHLYFARAILKKASEKS